jgi:hypothetical protein
MGAAYSGTCLGSQLVRASAASLSGGQYGGESAWQSSTRGYTTCMTQLTIDVLPVFNC